MIYKGITDMINEFQGNCRDSGGIVKVWENQPLPLAVVVVALVGATIGCGDGGSQNAQRAFIYMYPEARTPNFWTFHFPLLLSPRPLHCEP